MPTPDQDALAFGSWVMAVHGIDNIRREQWRKVWPRIRGFTFEPKPVVRASGDTAWIAAGWQSEATGADGRRSTSGAIDLLKAARHSTSVGESSAHPDVDVRPPQEREGR